ncbi:translation termination factor eRF1 [Gurleya vavrai]
MTDDIEVWRMKKLLKNLKDAEGNGTSMITLIIPPKDMISKASKMLIDEYGTASNIKSRVNRLSVLSAITSAQHKLKTYNKTPKNGLALFVGTIMAEDKEKKVSYGIEPIKPINTSLYLCDSRFHVDDLLLLFENEAKYAFVVIDGHMTLFSILQGNVKTVLQTLSVDLPKKHGRGGQSSVRFARLRLERRLAYVKKVSEICSTLYLTESIPNIEGIILAGHSDLKNEMKEFMDNRLKEKVIKIVDTNYGGENGLNEAIELCGDILKDVKFSKEKKIINTFFDEIKTDTGKYCYGIKDTMNCLEMNAVETLIVFENCEYKKDDELFVDWIAENYKDFACNLEMVSDKSGEGTQFVEGFGGIGGILRYKVEMVEHTADYESISDDDIF